MVQMTDKITTINIAIPIEIVMDTDIDTIMDLKIGENTRVLECDDYYEIIMIAGCDLDSMVKLFDIAPYLTLEKTYQDFFHTGVDLEVEFLAGLNVELDL